MEATMEKLQVYYQPIQTNPDHLESLTISYYDFDEKTCTYKEKIVLERGGEKYKIKRYIGHLPAIKPFLEKLDLANYKASDVNPGDRYFYIKYGDKVLATSNDDDIKDILEFIHFDTVLGYDLSEYKKCD
jgi:hypothetical protein